jgi:hypothetical protein
MHPHRPARLQSLLYQYIFATENQSREIIIPSTGVGVLSFAHIKDSIEKLKRRLRGQFSALTHINAYTLSD